jgi:hypothetical protein
MKMKMKILCQLGLGFASFLLAPLSHALDYHSPRIAALGGSGRAGPMLNDSIYLNPSYTSFLPTYALSGNLTRTEFDDGTKGRIANFSLQDGKNALFQAGAAYTLREDGSFIHLGASKSILNELGLGLGTKFFFGSKSPDRPAGRDLTLSTTWISSQSLQFALVADNLLEAQESAGWNLRRTLALGVKLNIQQLFLIYFDPQTTFRTSTGRNSSLGYSLGGEIPIFRDFFLRIGRGKNISLPEQANWGDTTGLGAGWLAPRLSLDYGYRRTTDGRQGYSHQFGFTAFF